MDFSKGIDTLVTQVNVQEFLDNIDYRVARTRAELQQAYELVYKEYLKRNYTDVNAAHMRFGIYCALPQATTFIAVTEENVEATATIIPDSPLGLPMEKIYHDELDQLRAQGKKLCEISMLASNTDLFKEGVSMMLHAKKLFFVFFLFKAVFEYVRDIMKLDYMCITINPKHNLTYEFLLFKDFGGLKTYDGVKGAPAIAKYLDVHTAENECKQLGRQGLYKMFFQRHMEPEKFAHKIIMSADDLRYFFVEKTDLFKTASPEVLASIKECYPSYDFSTILA